MMKLGFLTFDRNELGGAFGDLGTFVPLVTALIVWNGLDPRGIFLTFGLLYIYSGLIFGAPMPVQPMKAIAAVMITEVLQPNSLTGVGLLIGFFFVVLAFSNLIELIDKVTPRSVVRGIQFGLGLSLISIALRFIQNDPVKGWMLSAIGVAIVLMFSKRAKLPPALILLAMGIVYSMFDGFPLQVLADGIEFDFPRIVVPTTVDLAQGIFGLVVPQIPLTIGNAILATSLLSRDYFPDKKPISVKRLSLSHGIMNLVAAFLGGIPVCHGAGGLAAHHRFGARTGGAVVILGVLMLFLGLFYGTAVLQILSLFPFSILGVLLLFSGLELTMTLKDVTSTRKQLLVALFVAATSIAVQYGYVIGLVGGIILSHAIERIAPN